MFDIVSPSVAWRIALSGLVEKRLQSFQPRPAGVFRNEYFLDAADQIKAYRKGIKNEFGKFWVEMTRKLSSFEDVSALSDCTCTPCYAHKSVINRLLKDAMTEYDDVSASSERSSHPLTPSADNSTQTVQPPTHDASSNTKSIDIIEFAVQTLDMFNDQLSESQRTQLQELTLIATESTSAASLFINEQEEASACHLFPRRSSPDPQFEVPASPPVTPCPVVNEHTEISSGCSNASDENQGVTSSDKVTFSESESSARLFIDKQEEVQTDDLSPRIYSSERESEAHNSTCTTPSLIIDESSVRTVNCIHTDVNQTATAMCSDTVSVSGASSPASLIIDEQEEVPREDLFPTISSPKLESKAHDSTSTTPSLVIDESSVRTVNCVDTDENQTSDTANLVVTENFEPTSTPSTFKCSPDVRPKILKPDTAAGDCGQTDRPIKLMPIPALFTSRAVPHRRKRVVDDKSSMEISSDAPIMAFKQDQKQKFDMPLHWSAVYYSDYEHSDMEGYSSDDSAKLASSSHDKRQSQEQPSLGADEQKQEHPVSAFRSVKRKNRMQLYSDTSKLELNNMPEAEVITPVTIAPVTIPPVTIPPYADFTTSNTKPVNHIISPLSHAANLLPIAAVPSVVPTTANQKYSLFVESSNQNSGTFGRDLFSGLKQTVKINQTPKRLFEAENVIDDRHMSELSDTAHHQELAGYLLPCGKYHARGEAAHLQEWCNDNCEAEVAQVLSKVPAKLQALTLPPPPCDSESDDDTLPPPPHIGISLHAKFKTHNDSVEKDGVTCLCNNHKINKPTAQHTPYNPLTFI